MSKDPTRCSHLTGEAAEHAARDAGDHSSGEIKEAVIIDVQAAQQAISSGNNTRRDRKQRAQKTKSKESATGGDEEQDAGKDQ